MTRNILPTVLAAFALSVSPLCLTGAMAQDSQKVLPSEGSSGSSQQMKSTQGGAQGNTGASGSTGAQDGSMSGGADASGSAGAKAQTNSGDTNAQSQSGGTAEGSKQAKPEGSDQSTGQNMKSKNGSGSNQTDTTTGNAQQTKPTDSNNNGSTASGSKSSTQTDGGTNSKTTGSSEQKNPENTNASKQADQPDKTTTSSTNNVNITVEQKTEVRQAVKEVKVKPVEHVDFDVAVGTNIPHTVTLEPLPPRIVKIVPEYKSYRFFILADGRIVIVDPDNFQIVYIITA